MDFTKKTARFKRSKKTRAYVLWLMLIVTGASAMGGMGFYFYRTDRMPFDGLVVSTVGQIKTWARDRKNNLQQGVVKVKQLAIKKPAEEPQIHFEFYTALPDMQMTAPEPEQSEGDIALKKEALRSHVAANALFASSEELEHDLSEQLKRSKKPKKENIHDL